MKSDHQPLDRNVQIRDVVEHKLDHGLVLLLTEELDERLRRERLPALERGQPVLRERVIEVSGYYSNCL
jgi:hypothetical protein